MPGLSIWAKFHTVFTRITFWASSSPSVFLPDIIIHMAGRFLGYVRLRSHSRWPLPLLGGWKAHSCVSNEASSRTSPREPPPEFIATPCHQFSHAPTTSVCSERKNMRGIDCRRIALRLVVWLLPSLALAGCAGCSREANVPVTGSTPSLGGSCGQKDDGLIHIPPGYNSFIPPATGHSYADPQYGCGITRLTTFGEFQASQSNHHNYSTITPFNADSSRVMLSLTNGSVLIVDLQGNVVVPIAKMPAMNSSD